MSKFRVSKFQCKTLVFLTSRIIEAENIEQARSKGEKELYCQPNEFVGAEAIPFKVK